MKTPAPETAAGRKNLAAKGQALPGGEEPIPNLAYLKKAIRSVGRLDPSKRPALKALIRKRARELGALDEPGVKGTWAFANDTEALELAMMTRSMPKVRGRADVTATRTGPGRITVTHKSTGSKVGTLAGSTGKGWQGTHATGVMTPASPSMGGAMAGLIAWHNKMAGAKNGGAMPAVTKAMANDGDAVSLATPAVSASDGPRMTTTAGTKPAATAMSAEVTKVYKKLIAKGMKPGQAMALAKRAAAMHAKAAAA